LIFWGFTARSLPLVSKETLNFWATLELVRLWEVLPFPLWDGPDLWGQGFSVMVWMINASKHSCVEEPSLFRSTFNH
jgi:hypothetical protein